MGVIRNPVDITSGSRISFFPDSRPPEAKRLPTPEPEQMQPLTRIPYDKLTGLPHMGGLAETRDLKLDTKFTKKAPQYSWRVQVLDGYIARPL